MEHTFVLVVYDIEKNKFRNRVAEACKDAGLVRVQLSVFMGEMDAERRWEFFKKLKSKLSPESFGRIMVLPICRRCLGEKLEAIILGNGGKGEKSKEEGADVDLEPEVIPESDQNPLALSGNGCRNP